MSEAQKRARDEPEDAIIEDGPANIKTARRSGLTYSTKLTENDKLKLALGYGCREVYISFRASTGEGRIPSLRHGLIKSTFENIIHPDDTIRITRRGRIFLSTKHISTIDNLHLIEYIGDEPVIWSAIEEAITTKFVIRDIDTDYTLLDIANELTTSGVNFTQIVRFCQKGSDTPIPVVLVKELGHHPRTEICLDRILHKVSTYVENPKICYKCLSFGHFQSSCTKKDRCKTCGDCHPLTVACIKAPTCFRCGQSDHTALDNKCEVYKKEKLIVNKAKYDHIPYKEAAKIVDGSSSYANVVRNSSKTVNYSSEFPKLQEDTKALKEIVQDLAESVHSFISSDRIEKIENRLTEIETSISDLQEENHIIASFLRKKYPEFPYESLKSTNSVSSLESSASSKTLSDEDLKIAEEMRQQREMIEDFNRRQRERRAKELIALNEQKRIDSERKYTQLRNPTKMMCAASDSKSSDLMNQDTEVSMEN